MTLKLQRVALAFLFTILGASAVRADPIPSTGILQFTSGQLSFAISDTGIGFFIVAGEGIALDVFLDAGSYRDIRLVAPFDPSHTITATASGLLRVGTRSLNLPFGGPALAPIAVSMQFTATAESVRLFPEGAVIDQTVSITFPFQLSGVLEGVLDGTRYRYDLAGQGHGSIFGFVGREATASRYTFEAAAPVPEPGTLLLLGTGAVVLKAASRRRRSASN
jgi:hypothetical protein